MLSRFQLVFFRCVTDSENLCYSLDQSNEEFILTALRSLAFSRAELRLDRRYFPCLIGCCDRCDDVGSGFTTLNRKALFCESLCNYLARGSCVSLNHVLSMYELCATI